MMALMLSETMQTPYLRAARIFRWVHVVILCVTRGAGRHEVFTRPECFAYE